MKDPELDTFYNINIEKDKENEIKKLLKGKQEREEIVKIQIAAEIEDKVEKVENSKMNNQNIDEFYDEEAKK